MGCVHSLLYLQLGYEGEPCWGRGDRRGSSQGTGPDWDPQGSLRQLLPLGFSRDHRDDVAERLLTLKDGLVHPDPTILFHTCHSIAQVLTGSHGKKEGLRRLGLRDFPGSTCYL